MNQEIERKWLVKKDMIPNLQYMSVSNIKQGYINIDPEKTIRIRIINTDCYLTIKGKSSVDGYTRSEFEYRIPLDDGMQMLETLCNDKYITKTRYEIPWEDNKFNIELDIFHGFKNQGLVIAEIESKNIDEWPLTLPDWFGNEVTGNIEYYNSNLL